MEALLRIQNLQVDFVTETGKNTAVRDLSLQLSPGEILALVGESGSGKSVTALSIPGLLSRKTARYPCGEILFSPAGVPPVDLLKLSNKELNSYRGNRISMVFQEPMTSLNPVFTCGDQVVEAIRIHRSVSPAGAKEEALALFEKVKLPDPATIFRRYPHQLSGGQKQRVMIAMAMSCRPDLLICDEPTTALDVTVQKTILKLIRELQETSNMGILFITHDLGVVAEIADRAVVMYKGTAVEEGPVDVLFNNPEHPYTRGLLACRPGLHRKGERLPVVADFIKNRPPKSGSIPILPVASLRKDPKILMDVKNLEVWYPGSKNIFGKTKQFTRAVDKVNFSVYQGEILGLVGESGCGKTTLGRALMRLIKPTRGSIIYSGKDISQLPAKEFRKLRKELQIVFQDPYSSLNPRIRIGDAIKEPLQVHKLAESEKKSRAMANGLLEKVDLKTEHFQRYPHEFSGGQRQRIVIARALSLNPHFLVCDESVSALDVSVQAQVLNLLNDLKQEYGFTIVFISHDLSVIRYLCDRILVMKEGKIVESGPTEEICTRPGDTYTKELLESIPGTRFFSALPR